MSKSTWQPPSHQREMGTLAPRERDELPESAFAFPKQRRVPLNNERSVHDAVSRFAQVRDVNDKERAQAWQNIKKAAKHWNVPIKESSWREALESND